MLGSHMLGTIIVVRRLETKLLYIQLCVHDAVAGYTFKT